MRSVTITTAVASIFLVTRVFSTDCPLNRNEAHRRLVKTSFSSKNKANVREQRATFELEQQMSAIVVDQRKREQAEAISM